MMKTRTIRLQNGLPRHDGISLLEVLVALIILSVGLLGLANLQAFGLRQNNAAIFETLAENLAYDIADRMHANADKANDYIVAAGSPPADPGCINSSCSKAQLVNHDLNSWKTLAASQLPAGDGKIVTAGSKYTITVQWNDRGTSRSFDLTIMP